MKTSTNGQGWVAPWNELETLSDSVLTYTCYSAVASVSIVAGLPTPRPPD